MNDHGCDSKSRVNGPEPLSGELNWWTRRIVSGFLGRVARARYGMTARAGPTILTHDGLLEFDAPDVRQGGQPGEHIGHFRRQLIPRARANRRGELTKLLGQPEECGRVAASRVFLAVHL